MFTVVGYQKVIVEKAAGGAADYTRTIRNAVRGLWSGQQGLFDFMDTMTNAIRRGFTRAWYEGMASVGLQPEDQNDDERAEMNLQINTEILHVLAFANAIMKGDKANGGKLQPLLDRAQMWTNRYIAIASQAMVMAGKDKKLKWVWNPLKEHCSSCQVLNGRVYRASIWQKYDLRPRMRKLACGGWRCGCSLIPTADLCTPGRPPSL